MLVQEAAPTRLMPLLVALLTAGTTATSQEVMSEPVQYVSLLPGTFNEAGYRVVHNTGNCEISTEIINNINTNIITCPSRQGLLMDRVTQPEINNLFTNEAIQMFNTWILQTTSLSNAFITLQFSSAITVTSVVVYCLVLQDLRVREPRAFRLFSSTTEGVYPTMEIEGVDDSVFTVINSGTTTIQHRSGDDDDDDDDVDDDDDDDDDENVIFHVYEYRRYNLEIPEDRQTSLEFLRILMDFEGDNWIFVSEVEAYHIETPDPVASPNVSTAIVSRTTTSGRTTAVSFSTSSEELPTTATPSTVTPTTTTQNPTALEQNGTPSSNDLSAFVIAVAVAVTIISLLLCMLMFICAVVCFRKKRNNAPLSDGNLVPSTLHTYEIVDVHKCSVENIYEKVNTTQYNAVKYKDSVPPIPPPFPKSFKITTVNLYNTKSIGIYYHSAEINEERIYSAINQTFADNEDTTELELDLYDDIIPVTDAVSRPQVIQEDLCEDVYCEAFDCNHPYDLVCDYKDTPVSMCVPIYNEPTPLKRHEAPKLVEWSNINMLKKLGEGQFGDVFLAENIPELASAESKTLVAIKTLKGDYSSSLKQQFEKEIKFMARLKNAYVVQLLGVCNKGVPFIMMEYMGNGDLHMFLNKHYLLELGKDTTEAITPIDSKTLQYMALQIANGMRYLASYGFIHRDLAARNCLVGEDYIVKIADFGMTQNLYNEAYFIMQGKAILPVRWMAPESFFGRFSTKTDVWSYGITLWEIFTLCRKQPCQEMSDEQLIRDVQNGRKIIPKRPPYIPDKVYDVMDKCWMYNSTQRPDFGTVYNQLLNYYMINHEH